MTVKSTDPARAARLEKTFWAMLKGDRSIATAHHAQLFLEAVRAQPGTATCLENILASPSGLQALRLSVRADDKAQFVRDHVVPLLDYLSHPDAKAVCDGRVLQQTLVAIVDPPTAWTRLLQLYLDDSFLDQDADTTTEVMAWLFLELTTAPVTELDALLGDITSALDQRPLLEHQSPRVREYGYKIRKALSFKSSSATASGADTDTLGGRHDNDHADFRDISVYPTADEFTSTQRPFYRLAADVAGADAHSRAAVHLDNQFRLLREDMLAELREDLRAVLGKNKSKRSAQILGNLRPVGVDTGTERRGRLCALRVGVGTGLEVLRKKNAEKRKEFLTDNRKFVGHEALGALCRDDDIIGFGTVVRDVGELARDEPVLGLALTSQALAGVLGAFLQRKSVRFVLVDTPIFAYEPVLKRLKGLRELPLERQLLQLPKDERGDDGAHDVLDQPKAIADFVRWHRPLAAERNRVSIGKKTFDLDASQLKALLYAMESPLSVIQGPPGTGKSFIGALAAKLLLPASSSTRILVLSYTNHALDQFLEDLIKIGISEHDMTRLGSKSSDATASLSFEQQFKRSAVRNSKASTTRAFKLKRDLASLRLEIDSAFKSFYRVSPSDILEHLEFSDNEKLQTYWQAFQVPQQDEGFVRAGKAGKQMKADYLINKWIQGKGHGMVSAPVLPDCHTIWSIPPRQRHSMWDKWARSLQKEHIERLQRLTQEFDDVQRQVDEAFDEAKCSFIQGKRVIGCTTTGAAKYSSLIKAAKPGCVLVEEAGEILEAHVLTALQPDTKQLVLIGDHKQLRPKINNYALSVEKGDGYDLNRSLFERLILHGHRHATLLKQHRMEPEISQLVRSLTYPDLQDSEKTQDRPRIRGIQGRVTFINHEQPEIDTGESNDEGLKGSKRNEFEAEMSLKIVRYLGQQGYKTDNIVVLTPYLGQLRLLRDKLSKDNDPWLSDLDSYELIQAGLMTTAAGKVDKGRIRLSTIDNYQGEESDIVIASLTRSNKKGDIGFMKDPERLNVLLSRARNCLIMIGNMDTFMTSHHGKKVWSPFFDMMKSKEYLQDGLWIRCEQHPERRAMLAKPDDFDAECPDGGCSAPCGAQLKCGIHTCQRRCHRIEDHKSVPCAELVEKTCEKQHSLKVRCHERDKACGKCHKEEENMRRRIKRNLEMEKARAARQEEYRRELQKIRDETEQQKRLMKDRQDIEDEQRTLEKERAELAALKETRQRKEAMEKAEKEAHTPGSVKSSSHPDPEGGCPNPGFELGSAGDDWEYMKREEGAKSEPLDALMHMIGLEEVKRSFLNIKTTVDTAVRQGASTKSERLGCTLLGNPGTGKTKVARLYANFLTSMGVMAGSWFEETSGAKLANMGVSGCQKLLDGVLEKGGGVVFIDEAYQLSSGNSPGGRAVLDFLLAEVENLTSKVGFILAGYNKQMESFFAHNPGLPSRFPNEMKFADYTDDELLRIMESKINVKFRECLKAEGGLRGLYCRIVARRLGRGRGKEGFGNARAVENALKVIYRRQSERLQHEKRAKHSPDIMLLTKEDLIGPEPSNALSRSKAWGELNKLIGLTSVKDSVRALVDSMRTNYQRELDEEPIIQYSLNRVFLGNPGTGKTTVAKNYGQILVDLGMLSNGEVVTKSPADFVGSALGQSEQQTKGILQATVGKVLVIDEAYGLYGGGGASGGGNSDPYKTAVVDTIVAEVQSVPGDDRCVLLLGYKDQMEEMFQNVNPGLSRRFPLSSAFEFQDFDQAELSRILDMKLRQAGFSATEKGKEVALEVLDRARNRPNFGNAGEVDILLDTAKERHQKRLTAGASTRRSTLEAPDFDEDHDRLDRSETNVAKLFEGTVGCEQIVGMLQGYQDTVRAMKQLDMDPKEHIPFNFLFRGPPGTGKSTTARKMGKVFYDAGFLASADVEDCSASDLVGQYVGQTGPKVRQLLDKALGRVCLIDEAYRLAEGHFAKEALDEIVDAVTKKKYHKKLIIILAGYEGDINRLLNVNPGLTSRFPEVIDFHGLAPSECVELLGKKLGGEKATLERKGRGTMELSCLEAPDEEFQLGMEDLFGDLAAQANWASARDIETLAKNVFQRAVSCMGSTITVKITKDVVRDETEKMLRERRSRAKQARPSHIAGGDDFPLPPMPDMSNSPQRDMAPHQTASTSVHVKQSQEKQDEEEEVDNAFEEHTPPSSPEPETPVISRPGRKVVAVRDAGVSDEVWDQLQQDASTEEERERGYQAKLEATREAIDSELRDRMIRELVAEEEERRRMEEARKKLEIQGICPAGFHWIQQEGGWRCAGGAHFVDDAAVELL